MLKYVTNIFRTLKKKGNCKLNFIFNSFVGKDDKGLNIHGVEFQLNRPFWSQAWLIFAK